MSTTSPPPAAAGSTSRGNPLAVAQWCVVLVVGIVIVALIVGFNLIPRLSAGQKVLDGARPLFDAQRLDGTQAGVDYLSLNVDMADPLMTTAGGGASEVMPLVVFVSKETKLPEPQVLALLEKDFPHTTNLLLSLPFTQATAELLKLEGFLESSLHLTGTELLATVRTNFPALYTVITTLPQVTGGWNNVPNIAPLTRFSGSAVTTVPQVRDYFKDDVVPALQAQRNNFDSLDSTKISWIPIFLLVVGIVVILLSLAMIVHSARGPRRQVSIVAAALVPIVGVVAIILVLGWSLNSRVNHGQTLLTGLKPAFTQDRVLGARAGVNMVGTIVTLEDAIMTPVGGAAAQTPKFVAFVAKEEKLPVASVVTLLKTDYPHCFALLSALPLTGVSAELPRLETFLETTLKITPAQLDAALSSNFPSLFQTIATTPAVVDNWDSIPGTQQLTRFDGTTSVRSAPELATYLSSDVVPVLETQQKNFAKLTTHGAITWIGIVVLAIGIVATEFGLLMVWAATKLPDGKPGNAPRTGTAEKVAV